MGMRQPPQGAPQGPPPQDPQSSDKSAPPGGDISKLVANIYSQLTQLMDALSQSAQSQPGVIDPQDLQELAGVIKSYQSFVTQTMGGAPGAGKPKPAAGPGQVNPMQGSQPASNVKPVGY